MNRPAMPHDIETNLDRLAEGFHGDYAKARAILGPVATHSLVPLPPHGAAYHPPAPETDVPQYDYQDKSRLDLRDQHLKEMLHSQPFRMLPSEGTPESASWEAGVAQVQSALKKDK